MAGRKRRDSGPVAAPADSKESASHMSGPSDEQVTRCVCSKADPKLWELAKSLPTEELKNETNPKRRQNIEACLKYVNENGYPYPIEVFIAMDGVIKHVTERECETMDWSSLTASGKEDEAFLMLANGDRGLAMLVASVGGLPYRPSSGLTLWNGDDFGILLKWDDGQTPKDEDSPLHPDCRPANECPY
ncbi:hypothetical protein Daus18300_003337 [Diaporthe australafricana]|uniref:Uncharacterized protein n=1 Tax=Diaporthe australafricana TaxID=127596 RepID=A0ABR3XH23_9PEZI